MINDLRNVRDVSLKRKLTKRLVEGGETKRIGDNKLLIARLLSFKVSGTISGIFLKKKEPFVYSIFPFCVLVSLIYAGGF